jgi:two-component sensor histidine kinase
VKGEMPPDLSNILQLNLLAKQAWSAKRPDFAALNASRAQSLALLSSLEAAKTVFDRRSADSSLKLRRILYAVVGSTVLAMFAIAAWSSQRMLRRWQRQEVALLEREKQLSADLARSVESLQAAVADKTVLLREVQHRVKNNLAVITALLGIEADRSSDAAVGQSLMSMCDRVRSMALVHDRLSYSETAASIDFAEYVSILSRDLLSSFGADLRAISFHSDVNAILTLDEAVPCGLILNELLTNSLKHGFPSGSAGNIYLFLKEENGEIDLRYHDDGVGLPAQFDIASSPSLGMQIISDLATQLGGTFRREGSTGAAFRITATRRVHHPDAHADPLVAAV